MHLLWFTFFTLLSIGVFGIGVSLVAIKTILVPHNCTLVAITNTKCIPVGELESSLEYLLYQVIANINETQVIGEIDCENMNCSSCGYNYVINHPYYCFDAGGQYYLSYKKEISLFSGRFLAGLLLMGISSFCIALLLVVGFQTYKRGRYEQL